MRVGHPEPHFLGYEGRDAFADALLSHLRKVQQHYATLFESAPAQEAAQRGLNFPPEADDRDTLQAQGFRRVVLKNWNSTYTPGKTTDDWLVIEKLKAATP